MYVVYRVEALCGEPLVGSALQGRFNVMHPEMGQVWYPYILGSCGVPHKNISNITEGSTWASSC